MTHSSLVIPEYMTKGFCWPNEGLSLFLLFSVLQKMQAACLPLPSPHPPHQDDHRPMPSPPEKSLPPSNCPGATLVLKPAGALAAHPAVCSRHPCQTAIEHSQCYHRCPPAPGCCSCALLTSMDYGSYQHLQKGQAAGRMAGWAAPGRAGNNGEACLGHKAGSRSQVGIQDWR